VHEPAAIRSRTLSRARLLSCLLTLAVLAFGFLLWVDEADAQLANKTRLAAIAGPLGLTGLVPAGRRDGDVLPCAAQPAYPAGSLGGLFNRPGIVGGFAAGFLGAGLFGLVFGRGMVGELGGIPSILGLLFQIALLLLFARLIWTWWRADKVAGAAGLSPRQLADAYGRDRNEAPPDVQSESAGETAAKNKMHLPL
jgi:predicted lipid-binding transport protein (Tim44 family)